MAVVVLAAWYRLAQDRQASRGSGVGSWVPAAVLVRTVVGPLPGVVVRGGWVTGLSVERLVVIVACRLA